MSPWTCCLLRRFGPFRSKGHILLASVKLSICTHAQSGVTISQLLKDNERNDAPCRLRSVSNGTENDGVIKYFGVTFLPFTQRHGSFAVPFTQLNGNVMF